MDFVYHYWNGEPASKSPKDSDRGGFIYPFKLVLYGWKEWKQTGRYPDPIELAKRIKPQFVADINYLNVLIERGRPADPNAPRGAT